MSNHHSEASTSEKRHEVEEAKAFQSIPEKCKSAMEQSAKDGILAKLAKVDPKFVHTTVISSYEEMYLLPPFSERLKGYLNDQEENEKGPDFSNMKYVKIEPLDDDDTEPPFFHSPQYKKYKEEKKAAIEARIKSEAKWLPEYEEEMQIENLLKAEKEFKEELEAFKIASTKSDEAAE